MKNKGNTKSIDDIDGTNLIFNYRDYIPDWVFDKIKEKKDDLLHNVVYNIYQCGCIVLHEIDRKRPKRMKQVLRNGKRTNILICGCEKKSQFICKLKICAICQQVFLGKKERAGNCKQCGIDSIKKEVLFFQNDSLSDVVPKNPNYTEPYCKHRVDCLNKIVPITNERKMIYLWCYKCPKYEDIRNI